LADANESEHQPVFDLIEEGERQTLSPVVSNDICRTALELMRNAYQHAHARRIEAEIRYGDSMFRLRIRDDGKGIEPKVLKEGGRLGHWDCAVSVNVPTGLGRVWKCGASLETAPKFSCSSRPLSLTKASAIAIERGWFEG